MGLLRIGLIGCGSFSEFFAKYLAEIAEITAVADPDPDRTASLAKKLSTQNVRQYAHHDSMLDSDSLDAVVITSPNFAHAEAAIAAADRGLHVYCEKPMARTVPECWAMVRACQQNNVKLMVGHKRRLRPPWKRMIELTREDGPLGRPLSISASTLR